MSLKKDPSSDSNVSKIKGIKIQIIDRSQRLIQYSRQAISNALSKTSHRTKAECKRIAEGFRIAFHELKKAWQKHPLKVVPAFAHVSAKGVKRHRGVVASFFNIAIPTVALVALVSVVNFWSGASFALALECNGETIGYVEDKVVVEQALAQAQSSVVDVNGHLQLPENLEYKLTLVRNEDVMDNSQLAEAFLDNMEGQVQTASGLFVEDQFVGAVDDTDTANQVLNEILDSYTEGNEQAEANFTEQVTVKEGLYPSDDVVSAEEIKEDLTSPVEKEQVYHAAEGDTVASVSEKFGLEPIELVELNPTLTEESSFQDGQNVVIADEQPLLGVEVISVESVIHELDYESQTVENSHKEEGESTVLQAGEKGQEQVDYQVVTINGQEVSRSVTATTLLKAPVDEKIEIGTMEKQVEVDRSSEASARTSIGFQWPVNGGRVSSSFGYRWGKVHEAMDIAAPYGTSIYASASGTVEFAGWKGSYGYCVLINHGNGYKTRYAHCSSLKVSSGQTVSQGQVIAAVGATGFATGNHCHFEIIQNGTKVNPANYL
ncbi:M23 family metallopeptidase [Solibaculum mannosilyticum]|uniref:Metalloendopeptidase n=1 Tax=Solibaculum mannosilyticum TaxID=2780922 RepID=A0A7I8D2Q4_9FIRM|nr:M23 family metallopeptidase [Solibaculum mannosilyticum]BCI59992.1 metalloendopeptidase [Solibaculum mannosilyticum]